MSVTFRDICCSFLNLNSHGETCAPRSLYLHYCVCSGLAVTHRQPHHLVVAHQNVHVWDPAVLPLRFLVSPATFIEFFRQDPCSIWSRHSRLCGFATRPSRAALHPMHPSVYPYIPSLRLIEWSRNGFWFSLYENSCGHFRLWNNGFCRCEWFAVHTPLVEAWDPKALQQSISQLQNHWIGWRATF